MAPQDHSLGPDGDERYDVFISYDHDDSTLAERLSRRIRRYRAPRALHSDKGPLVVFRDVERLTAHPELGDALEERIKRSDHLLLICSPESAQSPYVDQEARHFIELHGTDGVTLAMAAGDATNSYPPAIQGAFEEPLYIDLSPTGSRWRDWRRFREGSLRIIAALLDVDFATLDREDERRRRRRRWSAVAATLLIAAGVGSAWLADQVPADTWRPLALPDEYFDTTLLPLEHLAVYRPDPDIRLFLGDGAEFEAQYPDFPRDISGQADADFVEQAARWLREEAPGARAGLPVAHLAFELRDEGDELMGRGDLVIHGHLSGGDPPVAFGGHLRYVTDGAEPEVHTFAPATMNPRGPMTLKPWPTRVLNDADLLPWRGELRGQFATAWAPDHQDLVYEIYDAEESFWEGNDGQWIQQALLTDGNPEREAVIAGESWPLWNLDVELWNDVLADPDWVTHTPPRREHVDSLTLFLTRDGERRIHGGDIDAGLADFIEREGVMDFEIFHHVTLLSADDGWSVARVVTVQWDQMAQRESVLAAHVLSRPSPDSAWQRGQGFDLAPSTGLLGLWSVPGNPGLLLVLTDREGFHASRDGGVTWTDFNHGEAMMRDGRRLRPVFTGTADGLYVLALTAEDPSTGGNNRLFRHDRRNWIERLRAGLVGLLGGPADP